MWHYCRLHKVNWSDMIYDGCPLCKNDLLNGDAELK